MMKINLIGMILNNAGRRCFDGALLDDDGKPMPAADSLHTLIMEYAKVINGEASDVVTTSREVLRPNVFSGDSQRWVSRQGDAEVGRHRLL